MILNSPGRNPSGELLVPSGAKVQDPRISPRAASPEFT